MPLLPPSSSITSPSDALRRVGCYFTSVDRSKALANGLTPQGIYGIVTERSDCQGLFSSSSSLLSSFDFNVGQLEYARGGAYPGIRKVCDRCGRCGGYNQCQQGERP
eukprot:768366-Hanusia_phi.AAC.7